MQTLPEAAISLRVYGGAKVNALPLLRIALRALPSVRSWSTACKRLAALWLGKSRIGWLLKIRQDADPM